MTKKLIIHFMPYSEIESVEGAQRIKKILDLILLGKIIIIQGKLKPEEETSLIQSTMVLASKMKSFKGIEMATISSSENQGVFSKMKVGIARAIAGDRDSLTIVGPASVVREVKKDPKKIELMLKK
jgi:hypothetical protein